MIIPDDVLKRLDIPLDPARVTEMTQAGRTFAYLEGHDVIQQANFVFGFGNWSSRLLSYPVAIEEGEQGANKTYYQVWVAHVEVEVFGVAFSDLGSNTRQGRGPASLEMAIKGAVTDGMKRCLKNWGDQFGLVLYDKHVPAAEVVRRWREYRPDSAVAPLRQDTMEPAGTDRLPEATAPVVSEATGPEGVSPAVLDAIKGFAKSNNIGAQFLVTMLGGPKLATQEALGQWWNKNAAGALQKWFNEHDQDWAGFCEAALERKGQQA